MTFLEGAAGSPHPGAPNPAGLASVKKKRKKEDTPHRQKSGNGPLLFPNKRKLIFFERVVNDEFE